LSTALLQVCVIGKIMGEAPKLYSSSVLNPVGK
jgi:hypothetical protein